MLQAAREQTIQKIIYTSSFFALGPTDGHVADESQVLATNTIGFLSPKSDFFPSFFRKKKKHKICFYVAGASRESFLFGVREVQSDGR